MKFPRNAKVFKGQLDAAPFAAVFFLLAMFMLLSTLVYTPGIPMRLQLPAAGVEVAGTDKPSAAVAIDAEGRLYYQNQLVERRVLRERLRALVAKAPEPMALVIQADRSVSHDMIVRLALVARDAGFEEARLAVLPRPLPLPPPTR